MAYAQALSEISAYYGCANSANCTADELSTLQWASLGVTNNPNPAWNSYYVPKAMTVAGWGQPEWLPYGVMTESVEYPQQTAPQQSDYTYLDWSTAQAFATREPKTGSLSSFYSW